MNLSGISLVVLIQLLFSLILIIIALRLFIINRRYKEDITKLKGELANAEIENEWNSFNKNIVDQLNKNKKLFDQLENQTRDYRDIDLGKKASANITTRKF